MLTKIVLSDTTDQPHFMIELPILRPGDPIKLKAKQIRQKAGRTEQLVVHGVFRVERVGVDASRGHPRQILHVVSTATKPTWQAIRKEVRTLAPTKPGKTLLTEADMDDMALIYDPTRGRT